MRFLGFLPAALLAGFLSLHGAASARAATVEQFTEQAFKAAQADGQPILVDISAPWCPTCAQQKPIIDRLAATPAFAKLVILHVDFDTQKDVVRAMGARMQSTLIVFHGKTREGTSVGDTNPDSIKALLDKSRS
ncbi:MAG: thiol reductase thioredoxin [Rhodospirillales bacterium 20-64-7]|nr:MAG: thiol reductase thioredoxin [Rhodospirillales bacterium 20-64-7]